MANTALWICLWLLILSTLVFLLGILGAANYWFELDTASGLATWSFGAVALFAVAISCLLPVYDGR